MQSTITYTNVNNITNDMVVNPDLVQKATYDTEGEIFVFWHVPSQTRRTGSLLSISLYDDLIVFGSDHFKVLHMISKSH